MKKNILVTGSHRSGTTWTGKVLSQSNNIRYVHEPFNLDNKRKDSPFTFWFEYLFDSPKEHQEKAIKYIESFYKITNENEVKLFEKINSLKELYKYSKAFVDKIVSKRTIIKDPIALMSTEWLYKNFDLDIIVLIRHPAAFIASIKIKNWEFDFHNYLDQKYLMNNYLKNYEDLIIDFSKNEKDIIDQGILLWNTIHEVIDKYQSKYNNEWYFVKHEDLSSDPIVEFKKIFEKFDLPFNSKVKNYITSTTTEKVKKEVLTNSTPIDHVKRNSKENIKSWKSRLTEEEISRIKKGTENVWIKFYSESDW